MKLRSLIISVVLLISSTTLFAMTHTNSSEFTPAQRAAIERIVHQYLVKNPQVLVEAEEVLQNRQEKAEQNQAYRAIEANKQALFQDPNTPTAGNPDGSVYVVEFFDYQCGHCRAVFPTIAKLINTDKNVKFFFKELPIFGGASKYAAKAALAAMKQGKYVAFHNKLFSAQDMLDEDKIKQLAQQAGLDVNKLTNEMQDPKYEAMIRANFALAQKLGIMGTPAFVVSNQAMTRFEFIPGATDEQGLQAAIQAVQK